MDYRMSVPRTVWTERHSHEISLKRVEAILSAPDVSSTLNYFEHFAFVVISPWRLGELSPHHFFGSHLQPCLREVI